MKRKELKTILKQYIKIYSKLEKTSELENNQAFFAGKIHAYSHILKLIEKSNDNSVL